MNDFSAWMTSRQDQYVGQLEQLVNIDSGSYNRSGVSKVLEWAAACLSQEGIEVERLVDG